jgi:ParB family chromosome partitioning protein
MEGLAASIKTDGLLQNLVVKPDGKGFAIVSGERRYRALKLLERRGELPEDFTVPVEVRDTLTKNESIRISTVENLQRANLAPLEETVALTKLVHKGVTLDDVAAQTGLSATTIRRRLALGNLCKQAAKALRDGEITLSQAEALTLGSTEAQEQLVEQLARGRRDFTAEDIKEVLLDERPTVALAIFPVEQYTGTITTDLFAEGETSYFDDVEQFFELQRAAVAALAESRRESAAWVELTEDYHVPDWQYRKARKGRKGGMLINLSPSGEVEVCEGLVKTKIAEETAEETAANPLAPKTPKASYAAPLRRYIAHHKSMAVQELLLASPRTAKEVAAVSAITNLDMHSCVTALAEEADPQSAYKALESQTLLYARWLGLDLADDDLVWNQLPRPAWEAVALYRAVKALSDHELDELHTLLTALAFGQTDCQKLDTGESFFNAVAQDLGAEMRNHWQPDSAFLSRRNSDQLVVIAGECGYAEGRSRLGSYKKTELVTGLLKHFEHARIAEHPTPAQRKAREWLPGVMRFPAINPDGPEADEDEEPADE